MEAPPLAFDRQLFTSREAIDVYIDQQAQLAEKERLVWRKELKEPLDTLVSALDLAFTRAEPKLKSYWEFVENSKYGLPDVWTRSILLMRQIDDKLYEITVTDSRVDNEVDRMEIRIKFPVGKSAPPYEWEVYTLNMARVVGREDHVWVNDPKGSDNYVSSGKSLPIPAPPRFSLQASDAPKLKLDKIAIGVPTASGDQIFNEPKDALKILREGIRQVVEAVKDPATKFKAFEPHKFWVNK